AFPDLRVNAAHFGGWSVFDLAVEYLQDENCFMDLSSAYEFLGLRRSRELIDLYGTDRLMFGSDYPSWDPQQELDRTRALGYGLEDFQKLTWHNAERFLGITVK
ncbi:MAG: amidohydrolase family protein, partial [Eggerthellales bacterium]|nr:amidohydrolase family protein [Eggerthellales bacterium]